MGVFSLEEGDPVPFIVDDAPYMLLLLLHVFQ